RGRPRRARLWPRRHRAGAHRGRVGAPRRSRRGALHLRAPALLKSTMNTAKDVIVRLLRNLGTRKEVEQYLKQYSTVATQKFAIIKVGGNILARDLDGLASSLTFLQNVGLYPVVLHGAGPQIDEALGEAGVPSERSGGVRVTTPRVLEIARRVTLRENL